MADPFDQQLQRVLTDAAAAFGPSAAGDAEAAAGLVARVHQRLRRQRVVGAGVLLLSAVVVLGLMGRHGGAAPSNQQVQSVGQAAPTLGATSSTAAAQVPNGTTPPARDQTPTTAGCPVHQCSTLPPPATAVPTTTRVTATTMTSVPQPTTTLSTTATSTTGPQTGGMIVETESASGSVVTLHIGQILRVQLAGSTTAAWSQPTASDARVLQVQPSGVLPVRGGAVAQYRGAAAGQAGISATQSPTCAAASPPCGMPSRHFSLTVIVSG